MSLSPPYAGPGRPRTITRERLALAGIRIGLPRLTLLGVAKALEVSPKALYKHFSGLESLKQFIAEEMFLRWPLPALPVASSVSLEAYLMQISDNMWDLVARYAGIAPYMLRIDKVTPAMLEKIDTHHQGLAACFHLRHDQARWLLVTLSYHCVAVADTIRPCAETDTAIAQNNSTAQTRKLYDLSAQALITGALSMLDKVDTDF